MVELTFEHPLDWGRHYRILFCYTPESHHLRGEIVGPLDSSGTVERHLVTLSQVSIAGEKCSFQQQAGCTPWFAARIPPQALAQFEIEVRLGASPTREGTLFGRYRIGRGVLEYSEVFQKLTVFETRMLGNEKLYRWLPYPRHIMNAPVLRTDLHTHSSGQISAEGLLRIALRHHIPYPIRLLETLGIAYDQAAVVRTPRFFFPPTDAREIGQIPQEEDAVPLASLSTEGLERLRVALAVPPDRQVTFGGIEITVYRYRTPISKHPSAVRDLLLVTAEEYALQGVRYAEITATSTSLLSIETLSTLHSCLPEIESETGVALRFLAGFPRNLPAAMLEREVEKLKIMGHSPYIVGVDFMGFEDNKISDMAPYIASIGAWATQHDPEFTLRIHAGENRKNLTNVKESLRLAELHRMRVRIGHAAHGLDDEAIDIAERLAREKLAMIEFNPDSNLALNNIDTAEELEITKCVNRDIPFVICSDGGGLFQTDVRQLETAACFAGVSPTHLSMIAQYEQEHLVREAIRFHRKQKSVDSAFFAGCRDALAALPDLHITPHEDSNGAQSAFAAHMQSRGIACSPESIASATQGKKPLLILGATGERYWARINPLHQQRIKDVAEGLVQSIEPEKAYLMIGRPKHEGLTTLLSAAVKQRNTHSTEKPLALVSATVQADQTLQSFTPGLTHVMPLEGSLFTVPHQLVDYVAASGGLIVFIGGGTFVRDAILIAHARGVEFALMKGPEGASTDKATMMEPWRQFAYWPELLALLQARAPLMLRA